MFMLFILGIVGGSFLIIRRYFFSPQVIVLDIGAGLQEFNTKIIFVDTLGKVRKYFLYVMYFLEPASYFLAFFASPHTRIEQKSDSLLGIPHRQKLCHACGHVVTKFDHHCIWVSNCIAGGNQVQFTLFLLTTQCCMVFGIIYNLHFLGQITNWIRQEKLVMLSSAGGILQALFNSFAPIGAQIVVFGIIAVSLFSFTLGQINAILINRTTFERLKRGRLCMDILEGRKQISGDSGSRILEISPKQRSVVEIRADAHELMRWNCYDQGRWKNLKEALKMAFVE